MSEIALMLTVFAGAFLISFLLISKVPPLLHTPLMSMTNALSAVTLLGALLLFTGPSSVWERVLGVGALVMSTFNLIGGFVITNRMLRLFKLKD